MNQNHGKAFGYAMIALWVLSITLTDLHGHYPGVQALAGAAVIITSVWRAINYVLTAQAVK